VVSTGGARLPYDVPAGLLARARLGEDWATWLEALPRAGAAVVEDWELAYDGPPRHGYASLVLPVRTRSGRPAMLKLGWPDDESEHEHLALHHWRGRGAVQLLRADPHRRVLLLERLHATDDLTAPGDLEACEVVAGLYRDLHVPAVPQLRTLTSYVERWAAGLAELPREAPLPRRLVEQVLALDRDFVADPGSVGTMIHGDLHYENVLAGDREAWLAIDPKPVSGDPHYELAPMLWNRWEEVVSSGDVRDAVRRRFHTLVDAAGLDEDRARDWVVVREVHNALWTIQDAAGRDLDAEERDWLTRCVTIAKAVQG
jgi:streptomycin 6-kinase